MSVPAKLPNNQYKIINAILEMTKNEIEYNQQIEAAIQLITKNLKRNLEIPQVHAMLNAMKRAKESSDKMLPKLIKLRLSIVPPSSNEGSDPIALYQNLIQMEKELKNLEGERQTALGNAAKAKNTDDKNKLQKIAQEIITLAETKKKQITDLQEKLKTNLPPYNTERYNDLEKQLQSITEELPEYYYSQLDAVLIHEQLSKDKDLYNQWNAAMPGVFSFTIRPVQRLPRVAMPAQEIYNQLIKRRGYDSPERALTALDNFLSTSNTLTVFLNERMRMEEEKDFEVMLSNFNLLVLKYKAPESVYKPIEQKFSDLQAALAAAEHGLRSAKDRTSKKTFKSTISTTKAQLEQLQKDINKLHADHEKSQDIYSFVEKRNNTLTAEIKNLEEEIKKEKDDSAVSALNDKIKRKKNELMSLSAFSVAGEDGSLNLDKKMTAMVQTNLDTVTLASLEKIKKVLVSARDLNFKNEKNLPEARLKFLAAYNQLSNAERQTISNLSMLGDNLFRATHHLIQRSEQLVNFQMNAPLNIAIKAQSAGNISIKDLQVAIENNLKTSNLNLKYQTTASQKPKEAHSRIYITSRTNIDLIKIIKEGDNINIDFTKRGREVSNALTSQEKAEMILLIKNTVNSLQSLSPAKKLNFHVTGAPEIFSDIFDVRQGFAFDANTRGRFDSIIQQKEQDAVLEKIEEISKLSGQISKIANQTLGVVRNMQRGLDALMVPDAKVSSESLSLLLRELNEKITSSMERNDKHKAESAQMQSTRQALINSIKGASLNEQAAPFLSNLDNISKQDTASQLKLEEGIKNLHAIKAETENVQKMNPIYSGIMKSFQLSNQSITDTLQKNRQLKEAIHKAGGGQIKDLKNIHESAEATSSNLATLDVLIEQINAANKQLKDNPLFHLKQFGQRMENDLLAAQKKMMAQRAQLTQEQHSLNEDRRLASDHLVHKIGPLSTSLDEIEKNVSGTLQHARKIISERTPSNYFEVYAALLKKLNDVKSHFNSKATQNKIAQIKEDAAVIEEVIPFAEATQQSFHQSLRNKLTHNQRLGTDIEQGIQAAEESILTRLDQVAKTHRRAALQTFDQAASFKNRFAQHLEGGSPLDYLQTEVYNADIEISKLKNSLQKVTDFEQGIQALGLSDRVAKFDTRLLNELITSIQEAQKLANQKITQPFIDSTEQAGNQIRAQIKILNTMTERPLTAEQSLTVSQSIDYSAKMENYLKGLHTELKKIKVDKSLTPTQIAAVQKSLDETIKDSAKLATLLKSKRKLLSEQDQAKHAVPDGTPGITKMILKESTEEDKLKHALARQLHLFYEKNSKTFSDFKLDPGKLFEKIFDLDSNSLSGVLATWKSNIYSSTQNLTGKELQKRQVFESMANTLYTIEKAIPKTIEKDLSLFISHFTKLLEALLRTGASKDEINKLTKSLKSVQPNNSEDNIKLLETFGTEVANLKEKLHNKIGYFSKGPQPLEKLCDEITLGINEIQDNHPKYFRKNLQSPKP